MMGSTREAWQSIGGQQLGTIWGRGAPVATDGCADWLHRETDAMLELLATDEGAASFSTLEVGRQAAAKARVQTGQRRNTCDAAKSTITPSSLPARAMATVGAHDGSLFAVVAARVAVCVASPRPATGHKPAVNAQAMHDSR